MSLLDTLGLSGGDVLGGMGATAANVVGKNALGGITKDLNAQSAALQDSLAGKAQFKPYSVSSAAGGMGYDASGNTNYTLANQGLVDNMNQQAQGLSQNMGGTVPTGLGGFTDASMLGAGNALTQSQMINPSLAGQQAAMGGLFNQQLGNYGQPQQALQGVTGAALGGAEGMLGSQANTADIDALRQQYAGLAGQAASGLGQGTSQQDIFNQLQGMGAGDRERQALELENRLFAQGRGGVSTNAYGGTPEQLAMAKAQEEARSANSLQAMQMSDALQNSAQQRALGLSGQVGQLAGASSGLQGAQINQGSALAGLGLQGTQAQQAMGMNQLQSLAGLQQQDMSASQAQQALQAGSLGQAQSLFGLGSQASALGGQIQGQDIGNLTAIMNATGIPMNQLLAQMQPALQSQQLAQQGRNTEASLLAQLGGQQISTGTDLGLAQSTLDQELIRGLSNIASQQGTPTQTADGSGNVLDTVYNYASGLFGDSTPTYGTPPEGYDSSGYSQPYYDYAP